MTSKHVPIFVGDPQPVPDEVVLQSKRLLRPDEVADILRISKSQVYVMVSEKALSGIRVGGALRVRSESVLALLNDEPE